MKNLIRCCILLIVSCVANSTWAQDPVFAQFYAAPSQVNPALSGVFNGQFRVHANYREQWSSILNENRFRTASVSFDYRMPVGRGDFASFGLTALNDRAGEGRFTQNRVHLTASFMKELSAAYRGADQYLVVGGQAGFGQNSVDLGRLWFSDQFDNNLLQPDFNTATLDPEIMAETVNADYFDANAGILYYASYEDNRSFYVGGAVHHLNEPAINFLGNAESTLPMRLSVMAGGELPLSDRFSLMPGIIGMTQGPSWQALAGTQFRYINNSWQEIALRVGGWVRVTNSVGSDPESNTGEPQAESFIASAFLETERWSFGVSYDFTLSALRILNRGRGAFELSLIYTHPPKDRKVKVNCPNF